MSELETLRAALDHAVVSEAKLAATLKETAEALDLCRITAGQLWRILLTVEQRDPRIAALLSKLRKSLPDCLVGVTLGRNPWAEARGWRSEIHPAEEAP